MTDDRARVDRSAVCPSYLSSVIRPLSSALKRFAPLLLDRARVVVGKCGQLREAVDPGKRLDGLDDQLRVRSDTAPFGFGRNARIECRAPGIADDVGLLGGLAAG